MESRWCFEVEEKWLRVDVVLGVGEWRAEWRVDGRGMHGFLNPCSVFE